MSRLTEKDFNGDGYHLLKAGRDSRYDAFDKLGQLEDLEEKLGIDLMTLTNSIGNRVYFVQAKDIRMLRVMKIELHKDNTWQLVCGDEEEVLTKTIVKNKFYLGRWHYNTCFFLTEEEAIKKLEEKE